MPNTTNYSNCSDCCGGSTQTTCCCSGYVVAPTLTITPTNQTGSCNIPTFTVSSGTLPGACNYWTGSDGIGGTWAIECLTTDLGCAKYQITNQFYHLNLTAVSVCSCHPFSLTWTGLLLSGSNGCNTTVTLTATP